MLPYKDVKNYIAIFSDNNDKLLSAEYNGANDILIIKCKCGKTYDSTFYEYLMGKRCRICKNKAYYPKEQYSDEYKKLYVESKGYKVKKLKTYGKKMILECPEGVEVLITFTDFRWDGRRCNRKCTKCGKSSGEVSIYQYAKRNNINYEPHYKISDCKYYGILEFDCALFDNKGILKYIIEYDGQNHFREISIYGGKKGLLEIQERDKIKNQFCRENKISLIRIPYWERHNIDEILNKEIDMII